MTGRFLATAATGCIAAMLLAGTAAAQTTETANDTAARGATAEPRYGEDIVVTAQKREQTLIDVPQSVSVVSGATLERNTAFNLQDYAKLVPGLQIQQANLGEARVVLRGINTGGVAATVATYVDETPFGSSSGQVNAAILTGEFDTFDVARVEVLRGPQGTLYGASSLGGVLKFITATPDASKVEGRARASVEATEHGDMSYMGSAMVNVPLSNTLAVRASGFYRSYGGYIDSVGTAGSDVQKNINDADSYGGRVSALWKPNESVSVRLTAILQDLKNDAGSVVEADPGTLAIRYGGLTQSQYFPTATDVRYRVYNGVVTAGLGFAELTSSTSYSTLKVSLLDDPTVQFGTALGLYTDETGPAVDIGQTQQTNTERFTQEVRLASTSTGVLEWLVGGYYTHEKGAILQFLQAYDRGTTTPFAGLPLLADIFLRSSYQEYAAFANATLHLGDRFDLSFGGRYSHNDQDASQGGTGLLAPPSLGARSKEDVFTWSVAPKFKLTESASLYGRVAKGFRPGGPNILPPIPAGVPVPPATYDSDSLVSYEVGFKAETADRTFGIDIAAFHIDWQDVQLFAQIGDYGVNANGGSAKSDGVEFTATLRPATGFLFSVNGTYTDARLTAATDPLIGGRDGDALPFVPDWSVAVNADYDWRIGDTTAYVGGSIRLLDRQSGNYDAAYLATYGRQITLPSYEVVDLRAGVVFGRFSIEAYAKNLTDSRGRTSAVPDVSPFGSVLTGIIRPRTVGVTLGAGF